jgi:predicted Zn finger-like uncharacterized protein
VIVTCERCETEFQLDDARVPTGGARVRCSRCKHAFFVMPPAAAPEEAVHQIAGLALTDDPTPDVTEDLPEESVVDEPAPEVAESAPVPSIAARAEGDDSESDWQFNGDLPADPGDSSPDLHAVRAPDTSAIAAGSDPDRYGDEEDKSLELASAPAAPAARAPAPSHRAAPAPASESADLESPVDWDFFDRDAERAAPAAPALPPRTIKIAREIAFDATAEPQRPRELPLVLRRAVAGAGWLATASLVAVALLRGLAPAAPAATAWPSPAPGLALEQVSGRWLDNISVGRLYVVSGRVHNVAASPTSLPRLVLELRDPSGHTVGDPIPLRGTSAPELLREADASSLATVGSDFPGGLSAGVTWNFEAVAWPLPDQATRFAIRTGS